MRRIFYGLLFGITTIAWAQSPGLTTLAQLRDQARPLLILAPRPDSPELMIQLRILEQHAAEAQDRNLVGIALPYNAPGTTRVQLSPQENEIFRRRFGVAPTDFTVILIGKDGGSKLRSRKAIPMSKLVETIDAMPMRQDEMRAKTGH